MGTDNKYNFIPAGTWVIAENGCVRYVTNARKNYFEDDGRLSGLSPSTHCHYINYRPLNPQELSDKLTELAGKSNKEPSWDDALFEAMDSHFKNKAEKTFINPPEPWEILSFREHSGSTGKPTGYIYPVYSEGRIGPFSGAMNVKDWIKHQSKIYQIHSVKRTSDGVVFKIGDRVVADADYGYVPAFTITEFGISGDVMYASENGIKGAPLLNLSLATKSKPDPDIITKDQGYKMLLNWIDAVRNDRIDLVTFLKLTQATRYSEAMNIYHEYFIKKWKS